MQPVAWLPAKTNELVAKTVGALESALGKDLVSAVLVGTAMNPTRGDRGRAPEILAVARTGEVLELSELATKLRAPMLAGARVRLVTKRELERSLDVFALEIADWKARHRLLAGKDVLGALEIDDEHLRFGIETELRGLVRRIRNRVLTGLATDRGRDDPREAIVAGYDRLLVAAYHALALFGDTPPADEPAIVRAIAKRSKAKADAFLDNLTLIRKGEAPIDPLDAFAALLELTEKLTELVDAMEDAP